MDGPKIKADILQIFKVQNNFINKADLGPVQEGIRKLEQMVNDDRYDITAMKEQIEAL